LRPKLKWTYEIAVGPQIKDLAGNSMNTAYVGSFVIGLPDLVVSNLSIPSEAWTGQQIDIGWTVTNAGAGNAETTWNDCIFRPSDDQMEGYPAKLL